MSPSTVSDCRSIAQNNAFFEHLQEFSTIRKAFDAIYEGESEALRKELEEFRVEDKFKTEEGKRIGEMRQRARDESDPKITSKTKFISVCLCPHA